MNKEIKLYKVEFNHYTDCCDTTVTNITNTVYLRIPEGGLIIKESEFAYYMQFGNGFKTLEFVGSMLENE